MLRSEGFGVRIQIGSRDVSLLQKLPELTMGPTHFRIQGVPGIKQPGSAMGTGKQEAGT